MANYTYISPRNYLFNYDVGVDNFNTDRSDQVLAFSRSHSLESTGLPLGVVAESQYTMRLKKPAGVGAKLPVGTISFYNNRRVYTRLHMNDPLGWTGTNYKSFGSFTVKRFAVAEQDPFFEISGTDMKDLDKPYYDWNSSIMSGDHGHEYPQTLGELADWCGYLIGAIVVDTTFFNSDIVIQTAPAWPEGTTIRDVVGWIALCAAGFAYISYDAPNYPSGRLAYRSLADTTAHTCNADCYTELHGLNNNGQEFVFNCLQVKYDGAADYTRYAYDTSITDTARNTIQISGNPLLNDTIAQSIVEELHGLTYDSGSMTWFGDADVMPGDTMTVTDTAGDTIKLLCLNINSAFDAGGLMQEIIGEFGEAGENTTYFTEGASLFDPDGRVPISNISGVQVQSQSSDTPCPHAKFGNYCVAWGWSTASATSSSKASVFSGLFAEAPAVIAQWCKTGSNYTGSLGLLKVYNVTENGFDIVAAGSSPSTAQSIAWIAMGKSAQ